MTTYLHDLSSFSTIRYIPNCPEAIEIMAAVASVGAVWSCTSPDFGVSGVLDRFRQERNGTESVTRH